MKPARALASARPAGRAAVAGGALRRTRAGARTRIVGRGPTVVGVPRPVPLGRASRALLQGHRGALRGVNPLLVFDGRRLVRATDYAEIADVDVLADGRLAAFSVWKGDTHAIFVREFVP